MYAHREMSRLVAGVDHLNPLIDGRIILSLIGQLLITAISEAQWFYDHIVLTTVPFSVVTLAAGVVASPAGACACCSLSVFIVS